MKLFKKKPQPQPQAPQPTRLQVLQAKYRQGIDLSAPGGGSMTRAEFVEMLRLLRQQ
ncbi:MAG TPA: hypothetical protein VF814_21785 [Casimicrobiaceae bacterium]